MSVLHTVSKSSYSHGALLSCLDTCNEKDGLLLIEDGVFSAMSISPGADAIQMLHQRGLRIYALKNDVDARGLQDKLAENISLIDYDTFVSLALEHQCVQSWY